MIKVNENGFIYDTDGYWYPPMNLKQLEIFNDRHRYLLVHGPRKCVERGSLVWTPSGQRKIEDLVIGDEVFGFSSHGASVSRVVGVGKSQKRLGVQLEANSGHRIRCSDDHPIWCCYADVGAVRFAYERSSTISHLIASGVRVWSPSIQLDNSVEYGTGKPLPECLKSYWLGAMTGDGTCNLKDGRRLGFTNIDPECIDLVSKYASSSGSEMVKVKSKSGCQFSFRKQKALASLILESGLSCGSPDKRIPPTIMQSSDFAACSYLMGLFDTDGTVASNGKQVSLTSSSEGLIRDAHQLCSRLGIFATVSWRYHSCTNAKLPHNDIYWHLKIYGEDVAKFAVRIGSAITRKRNRMTSFTPSTSQRAVRFGVPDIVCGHIRKLSSNVHTGCGFRKTGRTRQWHRERRWLNSSMLYSPSIRKLKKVMEIFPDDETLKMFAASSRWVEWVSSTPIESEFWDIGVHGLDSFIVYGIPVSNSGKTFGIIHKTIRHTFDVNGAMVAIVAKTLKNAKSAGVWSLLCRALPLWEQNCHGFKVVEGPKTTGDTKLSFVRVRNRHGSVSEIQCHSLEHASEVEAKFKGSAYSMFWGSEFDQYCDEHAFDILCDALRMTPFIPYDDHQIICDCNPPDTGENNFIYKKFFTLKDSKPSEDEDEDDRLYRDGLHRILVMISDNPQLDERERREMIGRYKRRKALYARYIEGKWVQDITDGHFSEVWDENVHVIGNADGDEENWEVLVPTAACRELLSGWDIGDRNHSFHIMEKITTADPVTNRQIISFSILDELVVLKSKVSTSQFCEAALGKIEKWNKYQKNTHGVDLHWRHWSDTSAFQFKASAGSTDASIVYAATDGKVALQAAPKYRNSNHDKVDLLTELLHLGRLVVSAQLAKTREMFPNVRKGGEAEFIQENEHKHPFDSLSYPILAELPIDFLKSKTPQTEKKREVEMIVAGV